MKPAQNLPSLRQLHVFEAVARHNSIGRAASSVSLSQPAVSQAIASLESRFGVTLFETAGSHRAPVRLHEARLAAIAG